MMTDLNGEIRSERESSKRTSFKVIRWMTEADRQTDRYRQTDRDRNIERVFKYVIYIDRGRKTKGNKLLLCHYAFFKFFNTPMLCVCICYVYVTFSVCVCVCVCMCGFFLCILRVCLRNISGDWILGSFFSNSSRAGRREAIEGGQASALSDQDQGQRTAIFMVRILI